MSSAPVPCERAAAGAGMAGGGVESDLTLMPGADAAGAEFVAVGVFDGGGTTGGRAPRPGGGGGVRGEEPADGSVAACGGICAAG